MTGNPLVVVPVLFLLSLSAAVILFAFFKSTAVVQTKTYQAGGAIAGFIIVYGILHVSFYKISGYQATIEAQKKELSALKAQIGECNEYRKARDIQGTVDPYSDHTKLVLAVTEADLPINKKFRLSAPCVDLQKARYSVYVLKEGRYYSFELFPDQDIGHVAIPIPQ